MSTVAGFAAASVAAIAVVGGIESALAQQEGRPVTVEVSECLEIESPEERLACFEKRVDTAIQEGSTAPSPATTPPSPATATTPPVPAPATTSPSPATATTPPAPAPATASASEYPPIAGSQRAASAPAESRPDVVSTITELRETVPNAYIITLENAVRIYPSNWGDSYRLTVEELRSHIQVERVQ
jgi:hypothetical protein